MCQSVFNRVLWLLHRAPMCCCLVVSSESVQQWRWIAKCVLSLTRCCDCYTGHHVLLSGCKLWVGTAGKVNSYKCVLSLTECCDCYTGHHVLFDWEALVMNVNSWMYASHVIIGIFLLFLQAPKWKQVARQSQDRPDNFETFTRQTGWELSQDRLENFVTIYHKTDWWLSQDRQENFVTITRQTGELSASFISLCHLVLCLKSILTEKLRINNNSLLDGLQELVYCAFTRSFTDWENSSQDSLHKFTAGIDSIQAGYSQLPIL